MENFTRRLSHNLSLVSSETLLFHQEVLDSTYCCDALSLEALPKEPGKGESGAAAAGGTENGPAVLSGIWAFC